MMESPLCMLHNSYPFTRYVHGGYGDVYSLFSLVDRANIKGFFNLFYKQFIYILILFCYQVEEVHSGWDIPQCY